MRLGSTQPSTEIKRTSKVLAVVAILSLTMSTAESRSAELQKRARPLPEIPADQQIEIAMSAGPAHISEKATIYVLGTKGYIQARTGTNGFSCLKLC